MKSKNICLYITIALFVVFSVGYLITVNNVSYALVNDEENYLYDNKLKLIQKSAKLYGENNSNLFAEKDSIYVKVSDLVKEGYILADDKDGNVFDPNNDAKKLNDLKIRITYKNDKVTTKVII